MASASVAAAPVVATKLSASAAFGSSQVEFTPLHNVHAKSGRVVAVTASSSKGSSVGQVVSSVLAAGLAITIAGSAFAATGPGGAGAERTAQKADELLESADKLIKTSSKASAMARPLKTSTDSPQRREVAPFRSCKTPRAPKCLGLATSSLPM